MPNDDSSAATVTLAEVRTELEFTNQQILDLEHRLAGLKAERDSLAQVERWMVARARYRSTAIGSVIAELKHTAFYGGGPPIEERPMHEWAADVLRSLPAREPIRTRPLLKLMKKRGYKTGATNEYETVFGGLNRISKRPDSPIVKIGGAWALREWYPDGVPETTESEEVGA